MTTREATRPTVAALFVEKDGPYFGLEGVDAWDEARDARLYAGPHPVVAHPPCNRWCLLAPLNESLYGLKVGEDGGCFEAALESVRRFGGVLEHPAYSFAWPAFQLPRPVRGQWRRSLDDPGWVTEVSQCAYGLPVRKRTWLYYVGPDPAPWWLDWSEPETTAIVSDLGAGGSRLRGEDWRPGVQYAAASSTPPAFRDVLIGLARSAHVQRREAA